MLGIVFMAFVDLLNATLPPGGFRIRLVDGPNRCSGRVEVRLRAQWGTVCDDDWDVKDAAVVCRELGCGPAVSAVVRAGFGQGNGTVWMDDVHCAGSECSLSQCSHRPFGENDCLHSEDAGAVCSAGLGQPTLSLSSSHAALLPGDELRFRCVAPPDVGAPLRFRLHKCGAEGALATASESGGAGTLLAVRSVDASHEGSYTCLYAVRGNDTLRSSHSRSIAIRVVVLLQPNISISSPAGGEVAWGPRGPAVIRGQGFSIVCSTGPQYPGGRFLLSLGGSGSGVATAPASLNHSASFLFPAAELSHRGDYGCVYETAVSGRTFSSPASEPLPLAVTDSRTLVIALGVSAGLLLLVLPPILCFLVFRKRSFSTGRFRVQKTARNSRTMDTYPTNGNVAEEEEEQDYVNVQMFSFNEYEEEEDGSGSEADYVNCSQPTKNKYYKDENVYKNA